jgi:hypothetical protein
MNFFTALTVGWLATPAYWTGVQVWAISGDKL